MSSSLSIINTYGNNNTSALLSQTVVDNDPPSITGDSGNVGVGTTSPSERIDVIGNMEIRFIEYFFIWINLFVECGLFNKIVNKAFILSILKYITSYFVARFRCLTSVLEHFHSVMYAL